jgi:hypothetical protein
MTCTQIICYYNKVKRVYMKQLQNFTIVDRGITVLDDALFYCNYCKKEFTNTIKNIVYKNIVVLIVATMKVV